MNIRQAVFFRDERYNKSFFDAVLSRTDVCWGYDGRSSCCFGQGHRLDNDRFQRHEGLPKASDGAGVIPDRIIATEICCSARELG